MKLLSLLKFAEFLARMYTWLSVVAKQVHLLTGTKLPFATVRAES